MMAAFRHDDGNFPAIRQASSRGGGSRSTLLQNSITMVIECFFLVSILLPLMLTQQKLHKARYAKFSTFKATDSVPESAADLHPPVPQMPNTCQGHMSHSAKAALDARKRQKAEASFPKREDKGEPSEVPWMRHRLRRCLPFWKTFCKSTLVLNWIATGFDLRWKPETCPPPLDTFIKTTNLLLIMLGSCRLPFMICY